MDVLRRFLDLQDGIDGLAQQYASLPGMLFRLLCDGARMRGALADAVDGAGELLHGVADAGDAAADGLFALDPLRDVHGEFDDLEGAAVGVENRIVGGLQPDGGAMLGKPVKTGALEFAFAEIGPEVTVCLAAHQYVIANMLWCCPCTSSSV